MRVNEVFGHRAFSIPTPDPFWLMPQCRVGVEFEFENPKARDYGDLHDKILVSGWWAAHDDGSLRDHGIEYVLKEPLLGKELKEALEFFFVNWPPLEQTYRTSIHVHIDATDLSLEQLQTTCLAYALVEAGMFNFVGEDRHRSNYCSPWNGSIEFLQQVAGNLYHKVGADSKSVDYLARHSPRYAALNLAALAKYGSLEFRHLGTCREMDKLVSWINGCMALKDVATRIPYEELCNAMYTPAENIYRLIFGNAFTNFYNGLDPAKHHECVETGNILISYLHAEVSSQQLVALKGIIGNNPAFTKALEGMAPKKKERE